MEKVWREGGGGGGGRVETDWEKNFFLMCSWVSTVNSLLGTPPWPDLGCSYSSSSVHIHPYTLPNLSPWQLSVNFREERAK